MDQERNACPQMPRIGVYTRVDGQSKRLSKALRHLDGHQCGSEEHSRLHVIEAYMVVQCNECRLLKS